MADTEPSQEIKTESTATAETNGAATADEPMSAFIVGYTGEVGKQLVKELAKRNTFQKLKLVGRRIVENEDEAISKNPSIEQVQVNFDELDKSKEVFEGLQIGFCCLGTTQAKSGKDGQWKIDHDYVVKVAELAKAGGCKQYHLVSSSGANAKSSIFYSRLKGQTEEDVKALGIEKTSIYRPGMLICDRPQAHGAGEWMARKLLAPMDYLSPGTMTNATDSVARAMINNVFKKIDTPSEIVGMKAIYRLGLEK